MTVDAGVYHVTAELHAGGSVDFEVSVEDGLTPWQEQIRRVAVLVTPEATWQARPGPRSKR